MRLFPNFFEISCCYLQCCVGISECHVRRGDVSPLMTQDDDDDDDPSRIRLTLQTKDSKAKKCSLIIGKVSAIDSICTMMTYYFNLCFK